MSDYFPPEIIQQTLLKLPVKSLIRFTTVCKSWRSTITSPSFISSHLDTPKNETLLLRRYDKHHKKEHFTLFQLSQIKPFNFNSHIDIEFPLKSQIGYFRIVGSCRGVVCLSDDFFTNTKPPIVLWNPCVRKHLVLPGSIINPKTPHGVVLGFGVAGDEFKVVRLVYYRVRGGGNVLAGAPPEAEVFSVKTGRWRKLWGIKLRLVIVDYVWSQVYLNGCVCWLGYDPVVVDDKRVSILVFRVVQEVFEEIALPDELARGSVTDLSLCLMRGSIAVVKYEKELGNESCEVWLMKEYGVEGSWSRLCSFPLVEGMEKVVALRKNGEALVAAQGIGLVALDLENMVTTCLGVEGTTHSFYGDNYVESLELLTGETEIAS